MVDLHELEERIIKLERSLEILLERLEGKTPLQDSWYWLYG